MVGHEEAITSVAFNADGTVIATGSLDGTVRLWDGETGELLNTLEGHIDTVSGVAFNPDGTLLASSGWDGSLRLWGLSEMPRP
ncbi:MAG: hypothetical protein BroJett018_26650 [Chloroflexota bacterium]|nr:MAG: hypothetical protein BroJett018_26650 [Chloroflexota bacterium]